MKIPYSTVMQQYFADLRVRSLDPGRLRICVKSLRYFGEFLLREQPGSQLLISHQTSERAKGYVAHRMGLQQAWADHSHKPTQERLLSLGTIHPSRTRSRRRGRPWGQEDEHYAAPPAEPKRRTRKAREPFEWEDD